MKNITTELENQFDENGFLLIPEMANAEELDAIREFCDNCVINRSNLSDENQNLTETQNRLLWIRCTTEEQEEFRRAATVFDRAWQLSADLLGLQTSDIAPKMRIFFKRPECPSTVPWHQDEAFYQRFGEKRREGYKSINCWISLDTATAESGCLKYIPGSHNLGLLKHKVQLADHIEGVIPGDEREKDDQDGVTLYYKGANDQNAVYAELPAGGMALHHCRTLHASDGNKSSLPRRAFVLIFQEKSNNHD